MNKNSGIYLYNKDNNLSVVDVEFGGNIGIGIAKIEDRYGFVMRQLNNNYNVGDKLSDKDKHVKDVLKIFMTFNNAKSIDMCIEFLNIVKQMVNGELTFDEARKQMEEK